MSYRKIDYFLPLLDSNKPDIMEVAYFPKLIPNSTSEDTKYFTISRYLM